MFSKTWWLKFATGAQELAVSRFVQCAVLFSLAFYITQMYVDHAALILFSNWVLLFFSLFVLGPGTLYAIYAARQNTGSGAEWAILGIWVVTAGTFGHAAFSQIFRSIEMPQEWLLSPFIAYTRIAVGIGFAMYILSPGRSAGEALPENRILVAFGWLLAGTMLGFSVATALWTGSPVDAGATFPMMIRPG